FLPASRSEAPPPRALGVEAEAEKFPFPFRRKKSGECKIRKQRKFFCEAGAVIGDGRRGGASGFFQEFLIK
ncbi:MAG TPA: hypothetical protein PKG83_01905, partial [bacterium]|nr:hypothetical protein [bacterium]